MQAIELLELAKQDFACFKGILWLNHWLKDNPGGTTEQFFKEKGKKLEKNIRIVIDDVTHPLIVINNRDEENFLRWCYHHLIDWSNRDKDMYCFIHIQVFPCDLYARQGKSWHYQIPKQQLADVLALAFKRGYLTK